MMDTRSVTSIGNHDYTLSIIKAIAIGLYEIFLLGINAQLFAGIWFIKMLFFASIVGFVVIKYFRGFLGISIVLLLAMVFVILFIPEMAPALSFVKKLYLPLLSSVYFIVGYYYREKRSLFSQKFNIYIWITILAGFAFVGYLFCPTNMLSVDYKLLIPYMFISSVIVISLLEGVKTLPPYLDY